VGEVVFKPLFFLFGFLFICSQPVGADVLLSRIEGQDLFSQSSIVIDLKNENKKGLVILFLSAQCPCSKSHIGEIKKLSEEFSDFLFVGINSNLNEDRDLAEKYFSKTQFSFPMIKDQKTVLADLYKAYKTPHAFVVQADGKVAYQGGVSSSHEFERAEKKYLREALEDLQNNKPVRRPEGRTLGCAIGRAEN
jgi:hypothetical protein